MSGRAHALVGYGNEDEPTNRGGITPPEAHDEMTLPSSLRLGELLLRRRVISGAQLHAALAEQDSGSTMPLGDLLVRDGVIDECTLVDALAEQSGLPVAGSRVEHPDHETLRCLSRGIALRLRVLPLSHDDQYLVVATARPPTPTLRQELAVHTPKELRFTLAPTDVLTRALERSYPDPASTPPVPSEPVPSEPVPTGAGTTVLRPRSHSDRVVDWMLSEANAAEATEITLDGDWRGLKVRCRAGDRVERGLLLPSTAGRILVRRYRAAGLDPARLDLQSGSGIACAGNTAFDVLASCASAIDECRVVVWLEPGSSPITHTRRDRLDGIVIDAPDVPDLDE